MNISLPARSTGKHQPVRAVAALLAQISSHLKTVRARRAIYVRTRDELIMLTDRELADIGIPRSHVRRVAREHAQMVEAHA